MDKKERESIFATDNLYSYTEQVMTDSGWNVKHIGCMMVGYMDLDQDQIYNYALFNRKMNRGYWSQTRNRSMKRRNFSSIRKWKLRGHLTVI